jgi:hypothetical protein
VEIGVKADGTSVREGMGRRVGCGTFIVVMAVNCTVQRASQWGGGLDVARLLLGRQ